MTQQNTASAEESAAASEELSGQAMHMKEMMGRFRLRDNGQGRQAALPRTTKSPAAAKGGGWGGGAKAIAEREPKPADIIALDDKEFGKY